jgi:hypothetical protein
LGSSFKKESLSQTIFLMNWDSKTTKKHIAEAKAIGLTLLGEGKNARYRLYQFK